jgi:hypothetical protein
MQRIEVSFSGAGESGLCQLDERPGPESTTAGKFFCFLRPGFQYPPFLFVTRHRRGLAELFSGLFATIELLQKVTPNGRKQMVALKPPICPQLINDVQSPLRVT